MQVDNRRHRLLNNIRKKFRPHIKACRDSNTPILNELVETILSGLIVRFRNGNKLYKKVNKTRN
jgi:hypothetical protein